MYWKRQPIIDESILINILNSGTDNIIDKLKKCQSITNSSYCNYIHKHGKNEGLICGTISKSKNGRCYTHSRKKNNSKPILSNDKNNNNNVFREKKFKIIVEKNQHKTEKLIIKKEIINIKNTLLFNNVNTHVFFYHYVNLIQNNKLFRFKTFFMFPKYIYDMILEILFALYKSNTKNSIQSILNVENNQQLITSYIKENNTDPVIMNKKHKRSKKNKKKIKKIIKLNNDVGLDVINNKIEETINTFEEKSDDDGILITLNILFKENKKLFKIYVNIILSNIDMFFKDVDKNRFLNIWRDITEYVEYENVLIYSDNNMENIILKVFSYVKCNYELIPKDVKILWVDFDKNSVIPFYKKYNIDLVNTGIKIYSIKDIKKNKQLPIDKLTVLYY